MWDKGSSRPQKDRFRRQAEYIVWGSNNDEVKVDWEANRIQVFFHEKPDKDTCSAMRHRGFRWVLWGAAEHAL